MRALLIILFALAFLYMISSPSTTTRPQTDAERMSDAWQSIKEGEARKMEREEQNAAIERLQARAREELRAGKRN